MLRRPPRTATPRATPAALAAAGALAGALVGAAAPAAAQQPTVGATTPVVDTRTEPRTAPRVTRKPATVTAPSKARAAATPASGARPKPAAAKPATTAATTPAAGKPPRPTVPAEGPLAAVDSGRDSARDPAVPAKSAAKTGARANTAVAGPPAPLVTTPPGLPADSAAPLFGAVPPAPAPAPMPPDPNIPGAPNVAGRITGRLAHDEVLAPIAATVGPGRGPEVVHLQVLLDAARFSPGAVSGVWNENTVYALRAFRAAEGLPKGDSADAEVVERLERRTRRRPALTAYALTAADVRGPFRRMPSGMYAQAKLDCLCYQSLGELLGERFHSTVELLRSLNPEVDFSHVTPGTRITVPNVDRGPAPAVARLVVDKRESSMRGLDAKGVTRFYLPVTVGSPGLPSPVGRLKVVGATLNPRYHYDPVVLGEARGVARDALLPPGPNSPVGVLWAQLSRPHVGLHGTPYPEEVGYTMSHGCVRIANWDARWVTPLLQPGLVVDFK